jgi:hypothetical protein
MPKTELKYPKTITTRVPLGVYGALKKFIDEKQKDYPRYNEGDAMRSAIVNHLKSKGYLDKGKNYL